MRLLLLVLVLLVPALATAALTLYAAYRNDRQGIETHLLETTRALSLIVDSRFGQAEALLWALATSPELKARDYAAFDAAARVATRLPGAWVVLEEPGRQVVNTKLPLGTALPVVATQEHWNGMSPGQIRVSNLFTGIVAGQPAVAIDTLLKDEDGSPRYLSVIMLAEGVSRILADQGLPPTWIGSILDRNGTVVARSHDPAPFVGKPAAQDTVERVQASVTSEVFESATPDGTQVITGLSRSPSSGWSTIVAVPRSELSIGAWRLAVLLATVSGLLLAFGTMLALHVARRIARPVEALAKDALMLGDRTSGSLPQAAGLDFRETAVLRQAIEETRVILQRQEIERDQAHDALAKAKETLEVRVEERTRELESANLSLRESRDRYGALFRYSPLDLVILDVRPDGRFVYEEANPKLLKSLGITRDHLVGFTPHEVFPVEPADYVTERCRICVSTKSPVEYEITGRAPIGEVVRRTVLVPLLDTEGHVRQIFSTSMDLTEQRRIEEQLRQAQRLEAVGQLTGGIAHDFNNLLTVVLGNVDLLRRAKPDRAPRLIDNIMSAVEHGRRLTSQLLAFSRRQPLRPEVVDLRGLIGQMSDMLAQSLRGDISLEIDLADDLWPVEVDPAQLQAALINLAANARDAMPKGGRFRVSARNMISHGGEALESVSVEVSDTGAGIPPDTLAKVFEPFFTTKPVGQGTGLGLAQVYGFVKQSGGSVDIRSEVGHGTTVTLNLKRAYEAQTDMSSCLEDSDIAPVPAARILLAEDNPQVAEVAMALLRERGHQVEHCASAIDALGLLDQDPRFDLVLSDLVMPGGKDGLDLAREVRQRWPALPVLLATGYSDAIERATSEGFPILSKPYNPTELDETLRRVLASGAVGFNVYPLRPKLA